MQSNVPDDPAFVHRDPRAERSWQHEEAAQALDEPSRVPVAFVHETSKPFAGIEVDVGPGAHLPATSVARPIRRTLLDSVAR